MPERTRVGAEASPALSMALQPQGPARPCRRRVGNQAWLQLLYLGRVFGEFQLPAAWGCRYVLRAQRRGTLLLTGKERTRIDVPEGAIPVPGLKDRWEFGKGQGRGGQVLVIGKVWLKV